MNMNKNNRPSKVKDLSAEAAVFEYDAAQPLGRWLHSAGAIQKQARAYEREGNDAQAYLMLLRHAILILEKLPQHPDIKDTKYKEALAEARRTVKKDLVHLETIKPRIEKRYEEYEAQLKRRQVAFATSNQARDHDVANSFRDLSVSGDDNEGGFYDDRRHALEASEHRDLAAKLAQRDVRRRAATRRGTSTDGVNELSQQILEAGRRRSELKSAYEPQPSQSQRASSYHYPSVPRTSDLHQGSYQDTTSSAQYHARHDDVGNLADMLPPKVPEKPFRMAQDQNGLRAPPVPGKYAEERFSEPVPRSSTATPDLPNPGDHTFKPSAYLENGTPLRSIFLPAGLRQTFLSYAAANTRKNIETCGILCGTLISNALFISKLVIPEQTGTSDTCETVNEGELFDYCDKEDLMVLGWIHTHPTQTCFMSSRDLHTHAGYQAMMPESIAIVCAPSKEPQWGIFRLTDPPGLKAILNCTQSGLFHPHAVTNTYTDAIRPGHVVEHPTIDFTVKDMRPNTT